MTNFLDNIWFFIQTSKNPLTSKKWFKQFICLPWKAFPEIGSSLLMYFSFVAVVALTIIGITGLYLGLVHLQNINAIFNTSYGNILIIKLSLAFPLVFLGRYNQLKIQDYAKSSKNILQAKNFSNDNSNNTVIMTHNEKGLNFFKVVNRSIKVESIIGISVLVAASFLSVTSPPSLSTPTADFIANGNDGNAGFSSTNTITADFSALAIALSSIILVLGIINFRKNQQNTKDVAVIS
ncbi:MAG: CopD family protein [Nitrosopumilus sp.]|nr:CopD family protein [Nitrosopumilus sp.]